jgi:Cu/Ag efflux protein CusF
MQKILFAATAAALLLGAPILSGATTHSAGHAHVDAPSLTEGEVRRVDKEAKKLTIRHGPIVNLDMPAMTMVFQVADAADLESIKAGDKIRFQAEKAAGAYMATRIEPANERP